MSSGSRVAKLLVDHTVCLCQRSGLHWFERPGPNRTVRPASDSTSLLAILECSQVQNVSSALQLHREALGRKGVLHDRGGSTGYRQSHGGDVRSPLHVSGSCD